MHSSSFLLLSESDEVFVSSSDSVHCESSFSQHLGVGGKAAVEHFTGFPALLLLDVVHVRVAEEELSEEEKKEVSLRCVVVSVGLVPLGELASLLVGQRSCIASLEISADPVKHTIKQKVLESHVL